MENSTEYFDRYKEEKKELEEFPKSLSEPLDSRDVFLNDSAEKEISVSGRGLRIDMKCGAVDLLTVDHLKRLGVNVDINSTNQKEWRILESYEFSDEKGNNINLNDLLQYKGPRLGKMTTRDLTILFHNSGLTPESFRLGEANAEHSVVMIYGNVLSPATLITVLHEMGHCENPPNEKDMRYRGYLLTFNKKFLTEDEGKDPEIEEKIAGEVVKQERDAWAFALKKLRPFMRSGALDKKDVLQVCHDIALRGYMNRINDVINPGLKTKLIKMLYAVIDYGGEEAESLHRQSKSTKR